MLDDELKIARDKRMTVTCITSHEQCDDLKLSAKRKGIPKEVVSEVICTKDNRMCSRFGIFFEDCICNCIPVESLSLTDIAKQCHFVTMPVEEMDNSKKRNVLYWWYATNIYHICGKDIRGELPDCLLSHIRKIYPSPTFTGFKKISK